MVNPTNIKRQFINSLKRGTGEAFLIAKNNPNIDFSNEIIKGALNIYAYDGQCENDRATYIFSLITISKQQVKIRKAILKGLATEQYDTWNLTHLFALTKLFAERNDTEAEQAIYDRFLTNPIEGSEWAGYTEILELNGFDGLLYISEKYGKYIEQNPDDWQDGNIIEYFKRENPTIKVDEGLKKEAKSNKYIRLYLQNIKRTNKSHEKLIDKPVKYADIIDEVLNGKSSMSYFRIRNLTPEEVNQIAERLLTETCDLNIEKMLDIFEFHKFPLKAELILNFAKQKRNAENKIVARAIYALKHLKSEGIREFALNKIRSSKNGIDYLHILISNYKKGDFNLLNKIANKTNNAHTIERLAGIYTDIYDANQTTECKEPLEILYSKMNCAIHRQALIEVLIKNKALSGRIREELKFDSYLETTQLIE